ncbi:MAG: hypothetical protein K6G03_12690 [Lachnospiraceae bacterium]|nr:hypothetical protein [Lachnospiraceae bacterium]
MNGIKDKKTIQKKAQGRINATKPEETVLAAPVFDIETQVNADGIHSVPVAFENIGIEELDVSNYEEITDQAETVTMELNAEPLLRDLYTDETENKEDFEEIVVSDQLQNVEKNREELAAVRATEQVHTLSPQAVKNKEAIVKKTAVRDENALQEIRAEITAEGSKTLSESVRGYIDDIKKKMAARKAKQQLKSFWKLKSELAADPLMSAEDKAEVLYNYAKSFRTDIEEYKISYFKNLNGGKREIEIENYLGRFEDLIHYFETEKSNPQLLGVLGLRVGSANREMFGKDDNTVLERAKRRAKEIDDPAYKKITEKKQAEEKEEFDTWKKDVDSSLSTEQQKAVAEADEWLMSLGIDSVKRLPFINRIMGLSARQRLFMYRIIENDHLEAPSIADMGISQTTYVPNVSKIQWKMYRVPFRLWEKAGKDGVVRHHWEKLEAALQLINKPEISEAVSKYASAVKEEKAQEDIDPADIEDETVRDLVRETKLALNARETQLDKTISAVEEYEEAIKKRDAFWRLRRQTNARIAEDKRQKAIEAVKALYDADKTVEENTAGLKKELNEKMPDVFKTDYTAEDTKGEIAGHTMYAASQSIGVLAKLASVPQLFKTEIYTLGKVAEITGKTAMVGNMQLDALLTDVNAITGVFATLSGTLGLLKSLKGIKATHKAIKTGDFAFTDSTLMITKSLTGVVKAGTGMGLGITSIVYADKVANSMMTGSSAQIDNMKTGVTQTKKALAVVGLAVDVADIAVQGKHIYHRVKASQKIEKLKQDGALKGDASKYMDGISKLDTRNKSRQAVATAFSVVNNVGNYAAASAGPAGSLAWAGISVGLSLTAKLSDYLMKENSHKKTAEEFMQMNDLSELFEGDKAAILKELKTKAGKEDMKKLKEALMNHMAAEIGFVTFKSLYKHIVGRYAGFLFRNLFYKDGVMVTEKTKIEGSMSDACSQMVKAMGLKVKYPTSTDEKTAAIERHPSAKMIAAKLGG